MTITEKQMNKISEFRAQIKAVASRLQTSPFDLVLLRDARELTIKIFNAYFDIKDNEAKFIFKKLNKRAASIAKQIEASIPKPYLLDELHNRKNPDAAWVLASRIKTQLGCIELWDKPSWDHYINLLKLGARGTFIPALTSKSYIVGKAYQESPHGSISEAIHYHKKAWETEQDGDAAVALGHIYSEELSDCDQLQKALGYLNHGVRLGSPRAMSRLAEIYLLEGAHNNDETERNIFLLSQRASELGNDKGTFLLARCYSLGCGTRLNRPKAIQLMISIGENYNDEVQFFLGAHLIEGKLLPKNVKYGMELLRRSARHGNNEAALKLSLIYQEGQLVRRNLKKAFQILDDATGTEQCSANIFLALGRCYLWGRGTTMDFIQAKYWLRSAYEEPGVTEEDKTAALILLEDWIGLDSSELEI